MGSSREYWLYAKECAKWAAETKDREDRDLFLDMAKAWTNIALVEGDVDKLAAHELSKNAPELKKLICFTGAWLTVAVFAWTARANGGCSSFSCRELST